MAPLRTTCFICCALPLVACSRVHEGGESTAMPATVPADAGISIPQDDRAPEADDDSTEDRGAPVQDPSPAEPEPDEPFDPATTALLDPDVPGFSPSLGARLPAPGFDQGACGAVEQQLDADALDCRLEITGFPVGTSFAPNTARVHTILGVTRSAALRYNPSCDGEGWRFSDPKTAKEVTLCEASCALLRGKANAALLVEFPCRYADL